MFAVTTVSCSLALSAIADNTPGAAEAISVQMRSFIYKKNPRRRLTIYYPDDWKPADKLSALVIFRCNIPVQREHFRQVGMVIVKPQLAPVNSGQLPS